MKGRLEEVGVDVPGVRSPPDPEGLASLEVGNESPVGPTANEGPCLGWGGTTPGTSEEEVGRSERCCFFGEPGTVNDDWL